jgi:single-strand DNA-binding protein
MKHTSFFSAVLKEIEWIDGILSVTFLNGKVVSYIVPDENIYYELCGAASIGSYYAKSIKGKFQTVSPVVNNNTMIKLQIIGHIGKDAIVKEVNGKNVINFSVAHSENYTNTAGEKVSNTTWVDCAYWTDKVAVAPYLLKGTQVYVEGQPTADAYAGEDGKPKSTLRCRVMSVQLLGSGEKKEVAPPTTPPPPPVWDGVKSAWVSATWNGTAWVMPGQAAAPVAATTSAAAPAAARTGAPSADDLPF